jgi:hypothetical protein
MIEVNDYTRIVRKLVQTIREWSDDPKACGCDTFMCTGTCLASRSRDAVEEALSVVNAGVEVTGTVDYVRVIRELVRIVEEWNDNPKSCECDTFIYTGTCAGTCLPARSRDAVREAVNVINYMDEEI